MDLSNRIQAEAVEQQNEMNKLQALRQVVATKHAVQQEQAQEREAALGKGTPVYVGTWNDFN